MGDINKKNKIHLQVYTNQANYITKFISLTNYIELFDGKKKKKKQHHSLAKHSEGCVKISRT